MVLPTQGHYLFSPGDSLPPSLTSRRNFVKSPQSLVSARRTQEAAEDCLHWKDLWLLSRYAAACLTIMFQLHIPHKLFDILMSSTANHAQTQSPQKENRSLISHLLHIAASPPDNAQKPHCNTLQHLDSVNWDSIPAELKKVSSIP